MTIRIFHQVGHSSNWNKDSLEKDKCGDGLILSPVHQEKSFVQRLNAKLRGKSLFDPQYYLPNSPKAKLASYEFFPSQITNGFSTTDFSLVAIESAIQCVKFQVEQGFEGLVIPARFIDQMVPKYFERQEEYTILPFLKALASVGTTKPVYLTLPLTSAMLEDDEFRVSLLNWVTGFPDIAGVYVLVNDERSSKQIQSASFLLSYMSFVAELLRAGLKVIVGYLNTESVLFSLIDGATLTIGSFENTRMFSLDKFIESDAERRGPKARMYMPPLLNWIQFGQALQIRSDAPNLWKKVYESTQYSDQSLLAPVEPTFNQPGLYKHHFICLSQQLHLLSSLPVEKRYSEIRAMIKKAMSLYAEISDMPLDLDSHGRGDHLQPWLDALNAYYRRYLKA